MVYSQQFELSVLGEVALTRSGQPLKLPSQKAYCMLAYASLSPNGTVRIADLIDLLWPHSLPAKARHSISQLFYAVNKRCAPVDLLTRRQDLIVVPPDVLTCDAIQFEGLVRSGQWRTAVERYGGAFLENLDVHADTRFEHWRDAVDARLLAAYTRCVERLIEQVDEDPVQTEAWTRQAMLVLRGDVRLALLHHRAQADQGRLEEAEHGLREYATQFRDYFSGSEQAEVLAAAEAISATRAVPRLSQQHEKVAFVGRTAELFALKDIWSATASGSSQAVLLCGDAGIGKTRLLEQVARFAAIRGGRVLEATPSPAAARIPFACVRDLLSECNLDPSVRAWLALPRLCQIGSVTEGEAERTDSLEPILYSECEQLVRSITRDQPLLVSIDDVQWVDESSLRLLTYVAYRCRSDRLMFAMCCRPEGEHLQDRFRTALRTRTIHVGPLPETTAETLLSALCAARSLGLTNERKGKLLARAGGNPFFLTALAEDLIRDGELHAAEAVPESVVSLILARVRQVSAAAQDVLRIIAITRSPEPIESIAHIGRRSPLRTARAVEELTRMALAADGPSGACIAHDLIADTVYKATPPGLQRYLHRQAARALRHRGDAVVASHAARARDWAVAFPAAMRAAADALAIGAYSEAEFFLTTARTAAMCEAEECEVAAEYLTFACGLDRFSSAIDLVEKARQHFEHEEDRLGLVRCEAVELESAIQSGARPLDQLTSDALQLVSLAEDTNSSRLAAEMLSVLYRAVELGSVHGPAGEWLSRAISIAERADINWKVPLLGKAAVLSYFAASPQQAESLAERLPELAGDDVRLKALAFGYVGATLMLTGRLREAEECYLQALTLAQDPALADAHHKANMNLAVLETDLGRYGSAKRRLSESGGRKPTLVCVANLGFLALEMGDFDGAEQAAAELRRRSAALGAPMPTAAAATLDGLAAWARQDFERSRGQAERVSSLIEDIPFLSDDSYARVLIARNCAEMDPRAAVNLLMQPTRRAAVPQLRIDLEIALQLSRFDHDAAVATFQEVAERANRLGATPIATRAAAAITQR